MSVVTDNMSEQDKMMLIGTDILKAKFITLLLAGEKQGSVCEQLLKSILPQLSLCIDKSDQSITKIYFHLILVGFPGNAFEEYGSRDTKEILVSLQKRFHDDRNTYSMNSLFDVTNTPEGNFFNLLPFGDTKSCKEFFATTVTQQTGLLSGNSNGKELMRLPSGNIPDENDNRHRSKKESPRKSDNTSTSLKQRRFIFFFIRPESEKEYSEQLQFAKFLSSSEIFPVYAGFPTSNSVNKKTENSPSWEDRTTDGRKSMEYHTGHKDSQTTKASVVYVTQSCSAEQLMLSDMIINVPKQKEEYALLRSDIFLNSAHLFPGFSDKRDFFIDTSESKDNFIQTEGLLAQEATYNSPLPSKNFDRPPEESGTSCVLSDEHEIPAGEPEKAVEDLSRSMFMEKKLLTTAIKKPTPLSIDVLGPIRIVGGDFDFEHSPRLSELIIYLAMHPEGSSSALWSTALWPDKRVPMQTIANRLSEARRALGQGMDYKLRLRKASDRYSIADAKVDWFLFRELAVPNASLEDQQKALSLVRGRPFIGLAQGYWVTLEGFQTEVEEAIVTCALKIGRWCLQYQEPEQALWAALQALKATPFDERLYRLQMRSHDMMGNRLGVKEVLHTLATVLEIKGDPLQSVHPKTANLYRILTGKDS
ncbi:MAG: bacterial transcriptional activator domain-containing protein [Firmicutes bacterium]|jgi:hypothetical protein|nr:bacterial transcriptional activator domain-containing protein [Bacillota bacterium]